MHSNSAILVCVFLCRPGSKTVSQFPYLAAAASAAKLQTLNYFFPKQALAVRVLTLLYHRGLAWGVAPSAGCGDSFLKQAVGMVRVLSLPSARSVWGQYSMISRGL